MQEMQEKWVRSLGWDDPLEKEMATHPSILAWESHGQRSLAGCNPWGCRVRHDWTDWALVHGSSIFSFLRDFIQFSAVTASIYISNISSQMLPFLQILANICYLWSFLMTGILTSVRLYLTVVLIYISLMISSVEKSLCVYSHLHILFGKMYSLFFDYFLTHF